MLTVRAMSRAPLAVAYWLGVAGTRTFETGDDVVFLCHGTPRSLAAPLESQLRYLRRAFDLVPLTAIADTAGESRPPARRRRAAIIFDDGLRTNVTVAYPILRSLGIPAAFFLCPGLIEQRKWIWSREARQRLRFAGPGLCGELAAEFNASPDPEAFVQWMKRLHLPDRALVEARIRQATQGYVPSSEDCEAFDPADWRELREMDPAIITIGSHSMTHPILPTLSDSAIEMELRESRRVLEAQFDRPVDLFSYPNADVDWRVLAVARKYYRAAVAHSNGTALDPYLIPSVHLPANMLRLALQLNSPPITTPTPARPLAGAGTTAL